MITSIQLLDDQNREDYYYSKIEPCHLSTKNSEYVKRTSEEEENFNVRVVLTNIVLYDSVFPAAIKIFPDFRINSKLSYRVKSNYPPISPTTIVEFQANMYEIEVYKYITDKIIKPNISPNFIAGIMSDSCDYNNIKRKYHFPKFPSPARKVILSITEQAGNSLNPDSSPSTILSLSDFLESSPSDRSIDEVFFQIFWALECMRRLQITHNDLHPQNILIAVLSAPIDLHFLLSERFENIESDLYLKADSKHFHIHTKYIPYIYDWNYGLAPALGKNPMLLSGIGKTLLAECSYPSRDLYTLFCSLKFGTTGLVPKELTSPYRTEYTLLKESAEPIAFLTEGDISYLLNNYTRIPADTYMFKLSNREFKQLLKRFPNSKFNNLTLANPIIEVVSAKILKKRQINRGITSPDSRPMLTLYNPYYCRLVNPSDFKTPIEYLHSKRFHKFSVGNFHDFPHNLPHLYTMKLSNISPNDEEIFSSCIDERI
jgi:hypothetical protein